MKLDNYRILVPLTEDQTMIVSLWLERFQSRAIHIWSTPELQSQILTIHPADFTNLIAFVEPGDCSELEFYRIRKLGADVIESTLTAQKSQLSQELKDMTLDALRGLVPKKYSMKSEVEIELSY